MRTDELDIDVLLVQRLVAGQFPRWAGLGVEAVDSGGTSNAMYRLGADLVVRLPRRAGAEGDVAKEHRWLPWLAPRLPVAVPVPLGQGLPAGNYPFRWSVYRWLDGATPDVGRLVEPGLLAEDLAGFIDALHRVDPVGGPDSYRSEHLAVRDTVTREAIEELRGVVDADAARAVWETALRAPVWAGPPVWIHADLQPGNVLVDRGRLGAVIDFGCLGLGDPAVDLIVAWYVLPGDVREAFRAAVAADDASWGRGRGWALSIALVELRYYRDTNPVMAGHARRVIREVLDGRER